MPVLVGTTSGLVDLGGDRLLDDTHIVHVARSDEGWWAIDDRHNVWLDGEVAATAPADVRLNCIQPADAQQWVGAAEAKLFRLSGRVLDEDEYFTSAPGRERWTTPWGGPPDVRSLSFGPDGVLYVNVHVGGILRYDNTGLTPTIDMEADVHQVVAHPDRPATVVAACALGLAQSGDGHTFNIRSDGLHAGYCRAVAVADDTVLVSASRGPRGGDSRLYRGSLAGGPLEHAQHGLPDSFVSNLDTHCLLATNDAFYAANDGTVWRSTDEGRTWEVAAEGLGDVTCIA